MLLQPSIIPFTIYAMTEKHCHTTDVAPSASSRYWQEQITGVAFTRVMIVVITFFLLSVLLSARFTQARIRVV